MAHKLYKDWQKQKLSSQQQSMLRPPSYAPQQYAPQQQAPQQSTMGSLFGGSGGGWGKREYADYPPAQERAFDPAQTYGDARLQQSWASDYTPSSNPGPTSYPYSAAAGDQQMFQQPAPQPYYGGQADYGSAQSGQGYSNAAIYENAPVPPPSFNGQPIDASNVHGSQPAAPYTSAAGYPGPGQQQGYPAYGAGSYQQY